VLRCRGLEFKMRNPSNTNVFYWEGAITPSRCCACSLHSSIHCYHTCSHRVGKLLSCYETSLPYSLDPFTLQTLGPCAVALLQCIAGVRRRGSLR
jgi:carotenoid cleavage dioxygenase-like enzyme